MRKRKNMIKSPTFHGYPNAVVRHLENYLSINRLSREEIEKFTLMPVPGTDVKSSITAVLRHKIISVHEVDDVRPEWSVILIQSANSRFFAKDLEKTLNSRDGVCFLTDEVALFDGTYVCIALILNI